MWWNSTYDMLKFAFHYREAIDKLTAAKKLRSFELTGEEWDIIEQLQDSLKVSKQYIYPLNVLLIIIYTDR